MPYTHHLQRALARSRAYTLLAELVAHGLRAHAVATLRAVATLAPLLPRELDEATANAAAAEHYTTFGLNLFAHESVFLDPECRLAGPVAQRVARSSAAMGFGSLPGLEPDHLAAELHCLAFLCGAEADAWEDRQTSAADDARRLQRDFLRDHLLLWLPALSEALSRQESAFYAAVGALLLNLCFDHLDEVMPIVEAGAGASSPGAVSGVPAPDAPHVPDDADAAGWKGLEDAGMRTVARRLLAPAHSGLFLARSDLVRLARQCDLPSSFGERAQMPADLFHAAGHFERLPALLNALAQIAAQAESHHAALEDEYPTAAPFVAPWMQRLDATRALLMTMRAEAHAGLAEAHAGIDDAPEPRSATPR